MQKHNHLSKRTREPAATSCPFGFKKNQCREKKRPLSSRIKKGIPHTRAAKKSSPFGRREKDQENIYVGEQMQKIFYLAVPLRARQDDLTTRGVWALRKRSIFGTRGKGGEKKRQSFVVRGRGRRGGVCPDQENATRRLVYQNFRGRKKNGRQPRPSPRKMRGKKVAPLAIEFSRLSHASNAISEGLEEEGKKRERSCEEFVGG